VRFWPNDTAGRIADVASVVGLGITVYVARVAHTVRQEVLRRARLPEILADMEALGQSFSTHLTPESDPGERARLIGRAEGLLNSLKPYSSPEELHSIATVAGKVAACKGQGPKLSTLLEMHGDFYRLIEEVRDRVRRG
jgi:hypothetical protein